MGDVNIFVCFYMHQEELKLGLKQGTTLLSCIREQTAKSQNHKLSPDEMENQTTVERLVPQSDELAPLQVLRLLTHSCCGIQAPGSVGRDRECV